MRQLSSCTACRSRKKRCLPSASEAACIFCSSRQLSCDLAGVEAKKASAKAARLLPKQSVSATSPISDGLSSFTADRLSEQRQSPDEIVHLPVCEDVVNLYFDIFHDKQQILFHRPSLLAELRANLLPSFIVLGIIALTARFSTSTYFRAVDPHERAGRYLSVALKRFHGRETLVSLHSLQGCILLSFVCFTEGRLDEESLLAAQAIRMVQIMKLPTRSTRGTVQGEVEIRLFWQAMMMDTWNSARDRLPRQLLAQPSIPKPMDEKAFEALVDGTMPLDDSLHPANRAQSIWSQVVLLTGIFAEVTQLLDMWVSRPALFLQAESKVSAITTELDRWLQALPAMLQNTPENFQTASQQGFGREFTVVHLIYHHQCQLLYFPYLGKFTSDTADRRVLEYVHRCKAHAATLSSLMWTSNTTPATECLWSPVNGHLIAVASTVLLHSLIFDQDPDCIACNKRLLEQNFVMLLQFQTYWPTLRHALSRLQMFHRYCGQSSSPRNFKMNAWMLEFLTNYSAELVSRPSSPDPSTTSSPPPGHQTQQQDTRLDWDDLNIEDFVRDSSLNVALSFP